MKEEWRDIAGFEALYQVSSLGRIRSVDREVSDHAGKARRLKGRILKTPADHHGYPRCNLHLQGKKIHVTLHIIVAQTFHGDCPPGEEVRHKDGNRSNSKAGNLWYGTRSQNHMDKVAHGTANRGERNGIAKLTKRQVRSIRRRYAAGDISQRKLGEEYGVVQGIICRIVNGKSWGWLQ